jgi:hypothetical protein
VNRTAPPQEISISAKSHDRKSFHPNVDLLTGLYVNNRNRILSIKWMRAEFPEKESHPPIAIPFHFVILPNRMPDRKVSTAVIWRCRALHNSGSFSKQRAGILKSALFRAFVVRCSPNFVPTESESLADRSEQKAK